MMDNPLDHDERQKALDVSRSFIVQAPAGSGKTELLTQRFLCLLSVVEQPEDILAITFTRKATAEMRMRIIKALQLGADYSADQLDDPLMKRRCVLARSVLERDQLKGWELLQNPARLRIHTIDAFNASLTQQLPILSQFGAQPGIVDNPDALYKSAVRRVISGHDLEAPDYQPVLEVLTHYGYRFGMLEDALVAMLARRDQWQHILYLVTDDRALLEAGLEQVVKHHLTELGAVSPPLWHELLELAHFAIAQCRHTGRPCRFEVLADYQQLPDFTAAALPAWQAMLEILLTKDNTLRKKITIQDGFPADAKPQKKALETILSDLSGVDGWLAIAIMVRALPVPEYNDSQWQLLVPLLQLLKHCLAELMVEFSQQGQVDYVEMAQRAEQALVQDDGIDGNQPSELALRLDHQIQHILIDEFQDTSTSQQRLLHQLIAGWQADDNRSLFLVGDPMQSIYRFRKAEVGIYLNVWRDEFSAGRVLERIRLTTNFRSQSGLVRWVNQAFNEVFPKRDDSDSNAVHYRVAEPWHDALHVAPVSYSVFADKQPAAEAEKIVAIIRRALQINDATHDVAILVRNRRQAAAIIPALDHAGIAYTAVDMASLASTAEIRDLQSLTQALLHPADHHSWLSVLRAPWCGLELPDLQILSESGRGRAMLVLNPAGLTEQGALRWQRVRKILQDAVAPQQLAIDLSSRIETLWLALGGNECYQNPAAKNNCERYFSILHSMESAGQLDDPALLHSELQRTFALPDTRPVAGRVKVMTIHKAKGLEFTEVILPGCGESTLGPGDYPPVLLEERAGSRDEANVLIGIKKPASDSQPDPVYRFVQHLHRQRDLNENQRVLYVAATRACQQLHILGHVGQKGEPVKHSPLAWLWPCLQDKAAATIDNSQEKLSENDLPLLQRLPVDWRAESQPALLQNNGVLSALNSEKGHEDNDACETLESRAVGVVVHKALQLLADHGEIWWQKINQTGWIQQQLWQQGINDQQTPDYAQRVYRAITSTLADSTGRWLLQQHSEARSEYALNRWEKGQLITIIIDRTFVENGTRWIIDYKTGLYHGDNEASYFAALEGRYRDQLRRYKRYMSMLDHRPIKTALYVPLFTRLIVLD